MENIKKDSKDILNTLQSELKNLHDCVDGIGRELPSGRLQPVNLNHFIAIINRIIAFVSDYCFIAENKKQAVQNELLVFSFLYFMVFNYFLDD